MTIVMSVPRTGHKCVVAEYRAWTSRGTINGIDNGASSITDRRLNHIILWTATIHTTRAPLILENNAG